MTQQSKAGAPRSVEEYIRRQEPAVQPVLERVRAIIRRALPQAEEVISYSIPAYRLHGTVVIFFAGWKEHFSIYPATGSVADVFRTELAARQVSKGTIRFPLNAPVPARLIAGIARLRASEARKRAAAGSTTARQPRPRTAQTRTRRP